MRALEMLGYAAGLMLVVGCDSGGGGSNKAAPEAPGTPPAAGTTDPHAAKTPAAPSATPGGRSAVPTLDEWTHVGEVTVKGSSALGCETKMVREWLRVSCHGKDSTGGTPTTVVVNKGGSAEHFTFAQNSVTSLVMPFVDGTNVEATFSWSDGAHKLTAHWPHGAPKPDVVGAFDAAP